MSVSVIWTRRQHLISRPSLHCKYSEGLRIVLWAGDPWAGLDWASTGQPPPMCGLVWVSSLLEHCVLPEHSCFMYCIQRTLGIPPSWDPNYVCTIYRVCVSKLISNIRSHTGYGVSYWISNIGYVEYWASKPNIEYPISDLSNIEFLNPISDVQCRVSKPDIGYPMSSFQTRYWKSNIRYWILDISNIRCWVFALCMRARSICLYTYSLNHSSLCSMPPYIDTSHPFHGCGLWIWD